jgi:hypothetical protein
MVEGEFRTAHKGMIMTLTMNRMRHSLGVAIAVCAIAATSLVGANPAHAANDKGLYGASAPTFDGVQRQSLAIIGLRSVGIDPTKSAVTWLLRQQCADGSFEAYRANTTVPCGVSDPVQFKGPDVNSTAIAAVALASVGRSAEARKAVAWLNQTQLPNWGWPYYAGGQADANSTGLAIMALRNVQPQDRSARVPNAIRYLGTLQLPCGATNGGALPFQAGGPANMLATSDAFVGIASTVPLSTPPRLKRNPSCTGSVAQRAASFLAAEITAKGLLTSDFGTGTDVGSTARAIIGLTSLQVGAGAVTKGTAAVKQAARGYALPNGQANPGGLGLLLMVSEVTDSSPRTFGGVNLIRALQRSER